jgi:archaellum component FlaG (FlaF/FlaG flagellin family)
MARTKIDKQTAGSVGAELTFAAVDATAAPNGNYFDTDGTDVVLIKNADSAPHTMTVDVPVIVDGVTVADRVVTIPAGKTHVFKPKDVHRQSGGQVHLNFDSATLMTVAVLNV